MDPEVAAVDPVEEIARLHQSLADRIAGERWEGVQEVLNLGAAVLLFAVLERVLVYPGDPLLDPAVIRDLDADHARLAVDLQTLEDLRRARSCSPDVEALAGALFDRLHEHLQRDARTIYRPLVRLQRLRAGRGRRDRRGRRDGSTSV